MQRATRFARSVPGLALGAAILIAVQTSPALAQVKGGGGTNVNPSQRSATQDISTQTVRQHFIGYQCLGVVSAGVRLRNASAPTTGGPIVLPPLPGSPAVWAGLYWVTLGNEPPVNAVKINGTPVLPVGIGPVTASPCWPELHAFAYYADVTPFVVPGANLVSGFDDSGLNGVGPETEGASLVVIYGSNAASDAYEILVTDGNDLQNVPGQSFANLLPVASPAGMLGTLTFIGGDGQITFRDDQLWNGAPLGAGNDWDASDPSPAPSSEGWDTDHWPVSMAPPFAAGMDMPITAGDCINWVATVLEVGPIIGCPVPAKPRTWGSLKTLYR